MGLVVLRAGARRARRLLLLTAWMTVGAAGLGAVPAQAATPATLNRELLIVHGGSAVVDCRSGTNTASGSMTMSYTASGTASGPYSGTFVETGTATGTVPFIGLGSLTSFSASFTIYSPSGAVLVRGTKSHPTSSGGNSGFTCLGRMGIDHATFETTYQATILTASGNYSDQGTTFDDFLVLNGNPNGSSESFMSALQQPVLISPTSKDQCKHGGWMNYPQFKNQGDCVSFVATGGKNPPSG